MIDDGIEKRMRKGRLAELAQMTCKQPAVLREVDDGSKAVRPQSEYTVGGRIIKCMVLIPGKEHGLVIGGPDVDLGVVGETVVVGVGESNQRREREDPHPVVGVHRGEGLRIEAFRRGIERGAQRHEARVVVNIGIGLHEIVPPPSFLGGPKAADFRVENRVVGILQALDISIHRGRGIVDQLLLKEHAIGSGGKLFLQISRVEAGHLKLRAPVALRGARCLEKDHIVIGGGNVARTVGDGLVEHFIHGRAERSFNPSGAVSLGHVEGSINDHARLHATEKMIRRKLNVPSGAIALASKRCRPQANGGIIPDFTVIINHRAWPAEIGNAVRRIVQFIRIRSIHQEAHFIAHGLCRHGSIADLVNGAGGRAAARKLSHRPGSIRRLNVELNLRACDLSGQHAHETSRAIATQVGPLPCPLIQAVENHHLLDSVGIGD